MKIGDSRSKKKKYISNIMASNTSSNEIVKQIFSVLVLIIILSVFNLYGLGVFWRTADTEIESKDASKDIYGDRNISGLVYANKFCKTNIDTTGWRTNFPTYYKFNIVDGKFYEFSVLPFIIPIVQKTPVDCE